MAAKATVRYVALAAFRRLPAWARRWLVRLGTPGYTVGAVCVIQHDERLLMLRQPHRPGWTLPGGLLSRGEDAPTGVVREVREETGLQVEVGHPVTTVVAAGPRRVDVIYRMTVSRRPDVVAGGEAEVADWVSPDDPDIVDGPTREILAALGQVTEARAYDGRVLA